MKVYLSGKITGDPDYKTKFAAMEKKLTEQGYQVFNPAVFPNIFEYEDFMILDFMALSFCEAIYLLKDWKDSKGAVREYKEALRLGLKVFAENEAA